MLADDTIAAMKRPLQVVAAVSLALTCGSASAFALHAKSDKKLQTQDAESLFKHANELEDTMAPGTPPYLLRIRVQGVGQLSAYPEGMYEVRFASPSEFRQDRTFGRAHFSAGANGDAKKEWSMSDKVPLGPVEALFMRAMSFVYGRVYLSIAHGTKPRVSRRTENGLTMDCVEQMEPVYNDACFDATTGTVLAVLDNEGFVYQYSDFQSWGTHLVPRAIIVFANNAPVLEAKVEALEALSGEEAQPSAFVPPPGAGIPPAAKRCSGSAVRSLKLIKEVQPAYPSLGGPHPSNATVRLWGTVDTAGRFHETVVVQSPGAAFEQAAMDAIKQWQYEPAAICGQPIEVDTEITVFFK
jgi:TonB family protein